MPKRYAALAALTVVAAAFDLSLARNHILGISGDDSYYLTLAQALATGHGLVVLSLPWTPLETSVPPGFPLLLAPLVALTSDHAQALRAIPFAFGVAAVPLTYAYARQLDLRPALALACAALVALNPGFGLYATIVTPETAFVCALLAMLIGVARWRAAGAVSRWGALAVAGAVALLELKLAAVLLLAPLVAFLFVGARRRAHALVLAAALAGAALPLLVTRLLSGASPAGTTYDADFGNAYGGLHGASLVTGVAATAGRNLVTLVYPTLAETVTGLAPDPPHGLAALARDGLLAALTIALLAGAVLLWRRTRDAGAAVVPAYLVLVTVFPIMNTRRAILVLPVLAVWIALGLAEAYRLVAPRLSSGRLAVQAGLAAALAAAVLVPALGVDLHQWRYYQADWTAQLLPDRPWLRYLDERSTAAGLVEVLYPRQVYLATGVHADSSLWAACAAVGQRGTPAPFDDTLARLRPDYVVAAGTPRDCVPDLIRRHPEYRQVFADGGDGVTIWGRTASAQARA